MRKRTRDLTEKEKNAKAKRNDDELQEQHFKRGSNKLARLLPKVKEVADKAERLRNQVDKATEAEVQPVVQEALQLREAISDLQDGKNCFLHVRAIN